MKDRTFEQRMEKHAAPSYQKQEYGRQFERLKNEPKEVNEGTIVNLPSGDLYALKAWLSANLPAAVVKQRTFVHVGGREFEIPDEAFLQSDGRALRVTDLTWTADERGFYSI